MHYIITDIHNDSWRFMKLLEKMDLKEDDHLYLLGDLFDRCMDHPDPAGVYFQVLKLGKKCTVIRGNHDHWLANYIFRYYGMDERNRALLNKSARSGFALLDSVSGLCFLKSVLRLQQFLLCLCHKKISSLPPLPDDLKSQRVGKLDGFDIAQGLPLELV